MCITEQITYTTIEPHMKANFLSTPVEIVTPETT